MDRGPLVGCLSFWYIDFNTCFMRCFFIFLSVFLCASFPLKIPVMSTQTVIQKNTVHCFHVLSLDLWFEPLE